MALRITLRIVDALNAAEVPWIWENPATSRMWLVPEVRRHLMGPDSIRIVADQCGFGARWRKRTVFLCHNLPDMFLGRLRKTCVTNEGDCRFSGRPHLMLSGPASPGVPWTRVAAEYPPRLCNAIAHALVGPARARFYSV